MGLLLFHKEAFWTQPSPIFLFQYYMDCHFQDITLTTNVIADDVMIHDEQYDKNLIQLLNKCCEVGLKLNPEKCSFGQKGVKFYGNTINTNGVKPDPSKVDIIIKILALQNKTELASFLGMYNYLSQYISHFSDVTVTLRELNKKRLNSHGTRPMTKLSEELNYTSLIL